MRETAPLQWSQCTSSWGKMEIFEGFNREADSQNRFMVGTLKSRVCLTLDAVIVVALYKCVYQKCHRFWRERWERGGGGGGRVGGGGEGCWRPVDLCGGYIS